MFLVGTRDLHFNVGWRAVRRLQKYHPCVIAERRRRFRSCAYFQRAGESAGFRLTRICRARRRRTRPLERSSGYPIIRLNNLAQRISRRLRRLSRSPGTRGIRPSPLRQGEIARPRPLSPDRTPASQTARRARKRDAAPLSAPRECSAGFSERNPSSGMDRVDSPSLWASANDTTS